MSGPALQEATTENLRTVLASTQAQLRAMIRTRKEIFRKAPPLSALEPAAAAVIGRLRESVVRDIEQLTREISEINAELARRRKSQGKGMGSMPQHISVEIIGDPEQLERAFGRTT